MVNSFSFFLFGKLFISMTCHAYSIPHTERPSTRRRSDGQMLSLDSMLKMKLLGAWGCKERWGRERNVISSVPTKSQEKSWVLLHDRM